MVNVPRIEKFQTSGMPTSGRINVNVRNNADIIGNQTKMVSSLLGTGFDAYNKIEDQKITDKSYDFEKSYNTWLSGKMSKLKAVQGDPTESYNAFDAEEEEFVKSYLDSQPGMSDKVREGFEFNISKVRDRQRINTLNQLGAQREIYKNNNYRFFDISFQS